jgi:carbamoyltransferase
MKVMGVNLSHDGSICVVEDGEIIFYQEEERATHVKHTTGFLVSFAEAMLNHDPDHIVLVGALPYEIDVETYFSVLMSSLGVYKHFTPKKDYKIHYFRDHHLAHAAVAFYNSGFEKSAVLVVDGAGQCFSDGENLYRECETMFSASYDSIDVTHKNLITQLSIEEYYKKDKHPYFQYCEYELPNYSHTIYNSNMSIAKLFSKVGIQCFGDHHCSGKVMGMSAYGSDNPEHPKAFVDGKVNSSILNSGLSVEDLCYRVQMDSLEPSCDLISKAVELSDTKNICLVGGYFLNCVNNYKYLKKFPDLNIYVEPNSSDSGTAIGVAKYMWHKLSDDKTIRPIDTLYLGKQADYSFEMRNGDQIYSVTPLSVAKILADGKMIALYQGKEESGPRALGNRSFLFDPRNPNGRDIVNEVKKREKFRPFAGTVLEEHAHDWFDMVSLESSPHMMYAVNVYPDKTDLVPALQHNDGTSRIQTVNSNQNAHYYNLIEKFYELTGVPMLLNTSFNLAGDTLVHTMDDAVRTCRESGVKYLYCPEKQMIIHFGG